MSDGNKIWGIVKTGSNQDGRVSQPITAPSGDQQEELLKKVYKQYNVDPTSLQYIEAHGMLIREVPLVQIRGIYMYKIILTEQIFRPISASRCYLQIQKEGT